MSRTGAPPWVRFAPRPDTPWNGLPVRQQRALLLVCVPLGLLSALTVWSGWVAGSAILVLDVAVAVVSTAVVPLLWTRHQLVGVLALAVAAALSPAATTAATAMAAVVGRLRSTRVAVAAALAGVAGHLVQGLWRDVPLPFGWWALCVAAVYAALTGWGAWARTRTQLLVQLHDRAVRAEREQAARAHHAKIEERARIAREMHDTLAHHLTMIAATAGALEYRADAAPAAAQAAAGRVRSAAGDALVELREILRVLRTEEDVLRPAPGLADLEVLVEQARADGTEITWYRAGEAEPPAAVRLAAYRVLQESLTNARRHAPGAPIAVRLASAPSELTLTVSNGPAARAPESTEGSGTGLVGLAERVGLLGGALTATPEPDGSFTVRASIPWQPWTPSASS